MLNSEIDTNPLHETAGHYRRTLWRAELTFIRIRI